MNAKKFKEIRRKRRNRQAKDNADDCRALSYGIMSGSKQNSIQALVSAYISSGKTFLDVSRVKILK